MIGRAIVPFLGLVPKGVVRSIAKRYVAGETLESALSVVQRLNESRIWATLDVLGENTRSEEEANETLKAYMECLEAISRLGLKSNISIKLTHFGLRLDEEKTRNRVLSLVEKAHELNNFVRIDMEDSSVTQVTLDIYRYIRERFANVGCVLQAYLKRTVEDAKILASEGANVRICKGIYNEPKEIAYKKRDEIRKKFLEIAEILVEGSNTYVAFATHDLYLIEGCVELVKKKQISSDRFEFQALLGVPVDETLKKLVEDGYKVRIYVPFGKEWYPYSVRRLKENPRIASYVIKHLLGFGV
jgi:proline dehydrogenase